MPLMQPQRRSGPSFWERFGPGGTVQRSAGEFAQQLGKEQLRSTFDPRTWNDRVTPEYDAYGRPVSAGVVVAPSFARNTPLEHIFGRTKPPPPLPDANLESARAYGDEAARQTSVRQKRADYNVIDDWMSEYGRTGQLPPSPARPSPAPFDQEGLETLPYRRNVSWDDGKRPRPPQGEKDEQILAKLKERLNPKQGTQATQKKIFDDDPPLSNNWWEPGSPFYHERRYGQAGASPLETDHPDLFSPVANHPQATEGWIGRHHMQTGGRGYRFQRSPVADAGYRQEVKGIRDEIKDTRDAGNLLPPPRHPEASSPHYNPRAELNLVPRPRPAHPLAKLATRIAAGRRGGV